MYIYNKSSHSRQIGEKSFLLFSPPREIKPYNWCQKWDFAGFVTWYLSGLLI